MDAATEHALDWLHLHRKPGDICARSAWHFAQLCGLDQRTAVYVLRHLENIGVVTRRTAPRRSPLPIMEWVWNGP